MVTNRMLDAALRYAARGWPVIPLHTPTDYDRCSCNNTDCASVGKHPRTQHGLSDASTDPETIGKWWGQWPKANIGVITNDLVVIDIDPRHGGDESYRDLIAKHGPGLTQTLTAVTGGGGQHLVFACPAGVHIGNVANRPGYAGPLGPGVDVRAYGGYIVAPPSLHQSGTRYQWEEEGEQPARLPLALYELLTARPERQVEHETVSAADILNGVDAGGRDWALFRLAAKLRYADVPYDWARTLVLEAAANARPPFPANEALKKLDSAYKRYEAGKGAFVGNGESRHAEGLDGRVLLDNVLASPIPPPNWLIDGFLVRGFVHLLYGESGHGKTTVGLEFIRQLISRGEPVVFIDEESGHLKIAGLLQDMGVDSVDEHLHYFQMPGVRRDDIDKLFGYVDGVRPALVIFDSLTDQMSNFGLDDNKAVEVNEWFKAVPKTLTMRDYRPCVLLLDHVTKLKDNVSHSAGSRAKRQKSDVLWYLEKVEDFDRNTLGKVTLTLYKNNPGTMPGKHTLAVGSREGRLICEPFNAMEHGGRTLSEKHERFLSAINDAPRSNGELQAILECGHDTVVRLAQDLINLSLAERTGTGRLTKYQPFVRSDESIIRSDENLSSDFSSDEPPLKGGHRTKRRRSDERHWWEKLDDDEEELL